MNNEFENNMNETQFEDMFQQMETLRIGDIQTVEILIPGNIMTVT